MRSRGYLGVIGITQQGHMRRDCMLFTRIKLPPGLWAVRQPSSPLWNFPLTADLSPVPCCKAIVAYERILSIRAADCWQIDSQIPNRGIQARSGDSETPLGVFETYFD